METEIPLYTIQMRETATVYAITLVDQFDMLQLRANEAGALALLLSDRIKVSMNGWDGWEDLNLEGFNDGVNGLAHDAFVSLTSVCRSLRELYEPTIERLRELPDVLAIGGKARSAAELAILNELGLGPRGELATALEAAVNKLTGLLNLQSSALEDRGDNPWHLVQATADELDLAYENFRKAAWLFEAAVVAAEQAQRAERRAA